MRSCDDPISGYPISTAPNCITVNQRWVVYTILCIFQNTDCIIPLHAFNVQILYPVFLVLAVKYSEASSINVLDRNLPRQILRQDTLEQKLWPQTTAQDKEVTPSFCGLAFTNALLNYAQMVGKTSLS